jgi:hypothetical protein
LASANPVPQGCPYSSEGFDVECQETVEGTRLVSNLAIVGIRQATEASARIKRRDGLIAWVDLDLSLKGNLPS